MNLSLTGIVISQLIKGSAQLWIVVGLSFLQETNTLLGPSLQHPRTTYCQGQESQECLL